MGKGICRLREVTAAGTGGHDPADDEAGDMNGTWSRKKEAGREAQPVHVIFRFTQCCGWHPSRPDPVPRRCVGIDSAKPKMARLPSSLRKHGW